LRVIVDTQGNVESAEVEKPIGYGLDEKALETVKTWKFRPATRNGVPVRVQLTMEIAFGLSAPPPAFTTTAIVHRDPPYTSKALKKRGEGTVTLLVRIDKDGNVIGVDETSMKLGDGLDKGAIQTVKTWKFQPVKFRGEPVPSVVTVNVRFNLPQTTASPAAGARNP
jgi:TonB family protein